MGQDQKSRGSMSKVKGTKSEMRFQVSFDRFAANVQGYVGQG